MNNQRPAKLSGLTVIIIAVLMGTLADARSDTPPPAVLPPLPPGVEARVGTNAPTTFSAVPPASAPPSLAAPTPAQPVLTHPAITSKPATDSGPGPTPFTSVKIHLTASVTNDLLTLTWTRDAGGALLYQLSGSSVRWDPIPASMYHTNARDFSVTVPAPILTTFYRIGAEVPAEPMARQRPPSSGASRRPPTRTAPPTSGEP